MTTLRPQVAAWEREFQQVQASRGCGDPYRKTAVHPVSWRLASSNSVYTLRQDGGTLTGNVEGTGFSFFGRGDVPTPVTEGNVAGDHVEFKAGNSSYSGTVKGDQIELERKIEIPFRMQHVEEPIGPRPAIGPPPDGSDPSIGASRRRPQSITVTLRRVQR